MEIALTVEGQRGLTWDLWKNFVPRVEACGYSGLYRSDHFVDADPPDQDSLEMWVSLTWAVDHTSRMEIGSLVTPLSFRHPVHTCRMAKELDNLGDGRFVLGVGAGWGGGAREHAMFGFDLLSASERFLRFQEGLEVITRLLCDTEPVSFKGKYYQLQQARLMPPPARKGGPAILVGGNGMDKVLSLAASYADEWNAIHRTPQQFTTLNVHLDQLLNQVGRPGKSVKRSMMTALFFSESQSGLDALLGSRLASELWERGVLVGCAAQVVDQLHALSQAGVEKVIIQWPDLTKLDQLETFAESVQSRAKTI